MKNYQRSYLALDRRAIFWAFTLISLAVAGFAGWGSIQQFGQRIAEMAGGSTDRESAELRERREADDPDGRASWFMFQRMYPFGKVPDDGRRRAWDAVAASRQGFGPAGASNTWTSIGPRPTAGAGPGGNVSGRINEIAVSPANTQIILVAGATGGIWRSTDGGTNFNPVSDSQVDLAVGSIAFAPSNPDIVYAGMGDADNNYFGSGVLKSTDAGATWARINNNTVLPVQATSMRILVDPANPDKVYLAQTRTFNPADCPDRSNCGDPGGVYVSTDGGVNWTKTLTGQARDLAIHPTNAQIVYATLRSGATNSDPRGLFKSTDGGSTWNISLASPYTTAIDSTKDFRVAVTAASADRVYAYFGSEGPPAEVRLEMSTDAGGTWTTRGVVTNTAAGLDQGQFGYNTYLKADPNNADTIWVGCRDFFKSTDGGVTFANLNGSFQPPYPNGAFTEAQQKVHTDQQSFAFLPGSSTTFFVGNDGGIFKTTDSGATFTSLNSTLALTQFIGLVLHPTDGNRSYAGAQDNGTQRRTPGTSGWTEFTATGDGGKIALDPLNPTIVFAGATNGTITRNTETGDTNSQSDVANAASFGATGSPARISFYAPVVTNGVDSRLYSGSWRLYTCSDCSTAMGLGTWTSPSAMDLTKGTDDVLNAIAVAKSNTNVIYTGSAQGRAMVSTDNGANWSIIETGLPNRTITNISVSSTDPTLVYLTVSGYGSGHVFRSVDSGTTWVNISNNLPDIPTSALQIDPTNPSTLYAGTDIGVFRSTDTGATWAAFNTGLPPAPVTAFSSQATGKIQLATYGRGVYELGPGTTTVRKSRADFDGDGKTDISVYRPSEGNWYLNRSTAGFAAINWGNATDVLVPGDYDGDGKADTAIFRASATPGEADYFILNSNGFTATYGEWGTTGDIPLSGDYDGDGKADFAVFRPSNSTWYILNSSNGSNTIEPFGSAGDIPLALDSDGDGKTNLAIYRPSENTWYIARSSGVPAQNFDAIPFGTDGDIFVPADYDGDGKDDIAVFRPSNGFWYIRRSSDGAVSYIPFGAQGDVPVPGDYDGDGKADVAVYRAGTWYLNGSTAGFAVQSFGLDTDIPVPSRYGR